MWLFEADSTPLAIRFKHPPLAPENPAFYKAPETEMPTRPKKVALRLKILDKSTPNRRAQEENHVSWCLKLITDTEMLEFFLLSFILTLFLNPTYMSIPDWEAFPFSQLVCVGHATPSPLVAGLPR